MTDAADTPQAPAPAPSPAPEVRTAVSNRTDFSASLESFQGPLDLLLYLIKENEVEITEIPIARILEQYLKFLDQASEWDLQLAGEFLVMAATLMEIKSRELLPVQETPLEGEEIIEDPRSELVRQLLEYRRLKEQARGLELLQFNWEQQRPRGLKEEIPELGEVADEERDRATAREALVDVDLYALFAAYEKILKSVMAQTPKSVAYDGESIEQKIERIEKLLKVNPFTRFAELVVNPGSRADIAATFVALLELVRRRAVRLVQPEQFGNIDVKVQSEAEAEEMARQEAAAAETSADEAVKSKAERTALQQQENAANLPWMKKKRLPARPKFEGLIKPEDVEELDAEESEIARRIDAILAAADAISERFEQSREGRVREDNAPLEEGLEPPVPGVESATAPADPAVPTPTPDASQPSSEVAPAVEPTEQSAQPNPESSSEAAGAFGAEAQPPAAPAAQSGPEPASGATETQPASNPALQSDAEAPLAPAANRPDEETAQGAAGEGQTGNAPEPQTLSSEPEGEPSSGPAHPQPGER